MHGPARSPAAARSAVALAAYFLVAARRLGPGWLRKLENDAGSRGPDQPAVRTLARCRRVGTRGALGGRDWSSLR